MSTKDRSAERSIDALDTLDALLLEAIETARRQGFDASEVADRLDAHSNCLQIDAYTAYTPPSCPTRPTEVTSMTDWEAVARKQLSLRLGDNLGDLEDATHELKDALESGDDLTADDIAAVRRALTVLQQTVEEDLTEVTDAEPYDTSAVGHVPPRAVGTTLTTDE